MSEGSIINSHLNGSLSNTLFGQETEECLMEVRSARTSH
jgi:hypothetical protein